MAKVQSPTSVDKRSALPDGETLALADANALVDVTRTVWPADTDVTVTTRFVSSLLVPLLGPGGVADPLSATDELSVSGGGVTVPSLSWQVRAFVDAVEGTQKEDFLISRSWLNSYSRHIDGRHHTTRRWSYQDPRGTPSDIHRWQYDRRRSLDC